MITVQGKKCKVVEDLGYQPGVGEYVKIVTVIGDPAEETKVAIGTRGCWRFRGGAPIIPSGPVTGQ
jgi:hypothetical protein